MSGKEIKMADEAESLEQAAITRELDSWQLVNGHGWEDTKQYAVESQELWLSTQEDRKK